jgi:opacity protein-like surface antigen
MNRHLFNRTTPTIISILIISTGICFAQTQPDTSFIDLKELHLNVSGFVGLHDCFDDNYDIAFDKGLLTVYGMGLSIQFSKNLGINYTYHCIDEKRNTSSISDGADSTIHTHTESGLFDFHSHSISIIFYPTAHKTGLRIQPYFQIGLSRNRYSLHADYTIEIQNQQNELIEKQEYIRLSEGTSFSKQKYLNGITVAAGMDIIVKSFLSIFGELQYHSINTGSFKGGVYFKFGARFHIF